MSMSSVHKIIRKVFVIVFLCGFVCGAWGSEEGVPSEKVVPDFAMAARVFAHMDVFEDYVDKDFRTTQCVNFLNGVGVYFSRTSVKERAEFTEMDCARVMGQIDLVFKGEAELGGEGVKLPESIDSWSQYCIMNDVKFSKVYGILCSAAEKTAKRKAAL